MQSGENSLDSLQKSLGYSFKNISLLEEALTHPSNNLSYSNQRLEFFGDCIVSVIISERIFKDNPDMNEGQLSSLRAALTSGAYMAKLAANLDLAKHLILNNPADAEHVRKEKSSVADAFESLIAAIYLDSNFDDVKRVVLSIYDMDNVDASSLLVEQNPKGILQELAAKNQEELLYVLVEEKGKDHEKTFKYEARFRGLAVCGEFSSSKKKAEASAALNMLKNINVS